VQSSLVLYNSLYGAAWTQKHMIYQLSRYSRRGVTTIHVLYNAQASAHSVTQEMGAARSYQTSKQTPTTLTEMVRRMCVVQHAWFVTESQVAFHGQDSVRFVSEVAHVFKTVVVTHCPYTAS